MTETVKGAKTSEFVKLSTAYTRPNLYGDISDKFIDYTPASDGIIIEPIPEVAIKFMQLVDFTELNLTWQPWVRTAKNGEVYKIYFVANQLTKGVLFGRNADGWKDVAMIAQRIADAFGNSKVGAKGILLTQSLYEAMPENLKPKDGHCWITKRYNSKVVENYQFTFLRDGHLESIEAYYTEKGFCTKMVSFLPIVEVPRDILVKVKSKTRNGIRPDSSLRIKFP